MNRIAIERILHRKHHARGSAHPRDLFDHDGVADVVHPRAALGFGDRHASQAELCGFAECFAREMARLVELVRQRLHFRFGEFAHRALQ